jgi:Peptidase C13 family
MSVRLLAALALVLGAAGCTQSAGEAPPPAGQVAMAPATAGIAAARWRAVLVAGDTGSPAFDNGVEALRGKLAAQGVRDIRLYSSDATRVAAGHLATAANLSGALRTGGGEACLAFITSHGSEGGFLLRPDRRLFDAASLDQALTEGCGSAPTVLIVSACHSGVFINERTRRPNRVILTAAAPDRASFGCGVDNDYTYYDRCLLEQFDAVTTWRELAAATTSCVETRERRLGVAKASKPQTFVGSAVTDLRLPGR